MKVVELKGINFLPKLTYTHNVEQAEIVTNTEEFEHVPFPDNVIAIEVSNIGETNGVDFNFEKIPPNGKLNISAGDGGFLNCNRFKMKWSYGATDVSIRFHTATDYSYKLIPIKQ